MLIARGKKLKAGKLFKMNLELYWCSAFFCLNILPCKFCIVNKCVATPLLEISYNLELATKNLVRSLPAFHSATKREPI